MFRRCGVVLALLTIPALASAQSSLSLRVGGLWTQSDVEVSGSAPGTGFQLSDQVNGLGLVVDLGLPGHFALGAHYLRHSGSSVPLISEVVEIGLAANEVGVSLERRFTPWPAALVSPYVGLGVAYGHLSLSDDIGVPTDTDFSRLDAAVDIFRLYASFGIQLSGGLGASVRAGRAFGSIDGGELGLTQSISVGGEDLTLALDYGGVFVAVAVTLFGF